MRTRRRARHTATLTLGAFAVFASAAPAWSASPALADGNAFVPGGQAVSLSLASGKGTPLDPGLYSTTLPVDETSRYIEVGRGEGERLEIGVLGAATWKGGAWSVQDGSQGLAVELTTLDGEITCESDSDSVSGSNTPGMLETNVAIDPDKTLRTQNSSTGEACRKATSYRLEVKRSQQGDDATPLPVQIAVIRTPRVTGEVKKPTSTIADMSTMPLSTSGSVEPGAGFASATALTPGGYDLSAKPGRRMFFRVHLGWGQRMSFGWQLPKNGSAYKPKQDLTFDLKVFNPALTPVTMSGSGSASGYLFSSSSDVEPEEAGVFTAPIDYANADLEASGDSSVQWQATPGWYYVALDIAPNGPPTRTFDGGDPIASVLSVRVAGKPSSGPSMNVAQPDPGTLSTPGSSGSNPVLWGGALVLGVAATAGVGYVLWRRDRA